KRTCRSHRSPSSAPPPTLLLPACSRMHQGLHLTTCPSVRHGSVRSGAPGPFCPPPLPTLQGAPPPPCPVVLRVFLNGKASTPRNTPQEWTMADSGVAQRTAD
ncbi:hypothetical protein IscW_ISCW001289, partial [Ixodes scapularis]